MVSTVLAGTFFVLGSTTSPASAASGDVVAKSNCAAFEPVDHGYCIDDGSGYTWLGTITGANGKDFICIDYLLDGHLGAHSVMTPSASNPLQNQFGQNIGDPTTRAQAYVVSKYLGSDGTSGTDLTDAAASLIARENMHDSGGMYPQLTYTGTVHDSTYGVPANVLARAQVLWSDAVAHFGGYSSTLSGMPATVQPGQSYTVTVHAQSSAAAGSNPMAGYVVTASITGGTITSGNGTITDANGDVALTFTADGTTLSLTTTVNNLPGVYPKIAVPDDKTQQRGLIATLTDQVASASATSNGLNIPIATTKTSTQSANEGDLVFDTATISQADADWSGVGATAELYGPYPTQPGLNDCQPAQLVGTVSFDAPTNGSYTTPSVKIPTPGNFVWVNHFPANGNYPPLDTPCGVAEETTASFAQPKLSTQLNTQLAMKGDKLFDDVLASDTYGATIPAHYKVLGPLAPAADGTCNGLDWSTAATAASGDFTVNGDGHTHVADFVAPSTGCYTDSESGEATATTRAIDWTTPGIPAETALVKTQPQLATHVHRSTITNGHTDYDLAHVWDTDGATIPGQWRRYVRPAKNGKCTGLDWSKAKIAAHGTFTTTGDGYYKVGQFKHSNTTCASYSEALAATATTQAVDWTTPGIRSETVTITTPKVPMVPVDAGIAGPAASSSVASGPHGTDPTTRLLLAGGAGLIALAGLAGLGGITAAGARRRRNPGSHRA